MQNNTSILFIGLILGIVLGYLIFNFTNKPQLPQTIIKNDTINHYIKIPEIEIRTVTQTITREIPDIENKKKADSLFDELECLKAELLKYNVKEYAKIDTVINKDTINASYEYFTKQWYINLKLSEREIQTINNTITIIEKEKSYDKYWYGAGGILIGTIIGLVSQ